MTLSMTIFYTSILDIICLLSPEYYVSVSLLSPFCICTLLGSLVHCLDAKHPAAIIQSPDKAAWPSLVVLAPLGVASCAAGNSTPDQANQQVPGGLCLLTRPLKAASPELSTMSWVAVATGDWANPGRGLHPSPTPSTANPRTRPLLA